MNLYRLLESLNPAARNLRTNTSLEFQKLEPRNLLAGDVTVFVSNMNLFVVGDDASNQIHVVGTTMADARVIGLEGTTINGGSTEYRANTIGLRGINISMNGGNDSVDVHAAKYNKTLFVRGGNGDDSFRLRNSNVGDLVVRGESGNDILQLENIFVVRNSDIAMNDGDDTIAVYAHAAGGQIAMKMGRGDDILAINNMGMFRDLQVRMGVGNDQVLMSGETWTGRGSQIDLGGGDDFMGVMPTSTGARAMIQRLTQITAGNGNDNLYFDADVSIGRDTSLAGQGGTNGLVYNKSTNPNVKATDFNAANVAIEDLLDRVFEDLDIRDVDPVEFGSGDRRFFKLNVSDSALSFIENGAPLTIDGNLELGGRRPVQSAVVTVSGFVAGQDELTFTSSLGNITGNFNSATGVLTFTGEDSTENYQTILRSVAFLNANESPAVQDRSIRFEVTNDEETIRGEVDLNVISVNDAPILTVDQTVTEFDLDDTGLQRPVVVDDALVLTDLDSTEYKQATITISSGLQADDVLAFTAQNGLIGDYDSANGTLTISGDATVQQYQEALRSVTFDTSTTNAFLGSRTLTFATSDGSINVEASTSINVASPNTLSVSTTPTTLSYTEGDPALTVDAGFIMIVDGGSASTIISGAEVQIRSNYVNGQGLLEFTESAGITGAFDAMTGTLALTGDATANEYQTLLRTVQYRNQQTGEGYTEGARDIEFRVQHSGVTGTAIRTIDAKFDVEERLIQDYLTENNLTSIRTDSGLHYIVEQEGNGTFPDENSFVQVNYRGTFIESGIEFDSGDGARFSLQGVIDGWTEGIPKFSEGGRGQLLIPSRLAYGEAGRGSIPPNATLQFDVELLEVEI